MYAINIDLVLRIFIYFLGWYGKWAVGSKGEDPVDLGEGGGDPRKVLLLLLLLLLVLLFLLLI